MRNYLGPSNSSQNFQRLISEFCRKQFHFILGFLNFVVNQMSYSCKFSALKDTNTIRRAGDSRRSCSSDASISGVVSEKFAGKFVWSCQFEHACDRSVDPSGMPERGLEEVILYRGEHVVARGASMSSMTEATTTSTTGARRRDDEGRRLQSSSCFGPLNSS